MARSIAVTSQPRSINQRACRPDPQARSSARPGANSLRMFSSSGAGACDIFEYYCMGGERHRNPFLLQPFEDTLPQFTLHPILIRELGHVETHLEHERPIARTGIEQDIGFGIGQQPLNLTCACNGFVE